MITREARQEIEIDRERKLVVVTVTGYFSVEAAHRATMETRIAIQSLGAGVGQHLTLYDLSAAAPAAADTADLIRMGFANPVYRKLWARKVAFCTPSSLLRRQVERIREVRDDIGVFDTRAAALAWLTAD
ncbi:hypothetical protein [Sphingomonas turrisvirgatae]|uniref:STAS/SEC14 domain-containing protein n=1 Tax=Sphingomonas turrisvirgatae TaxID=1888892 RepID=A0A1E3LTF9_9SPHN|nr:hypothetical protein [Sphingomonas turrisvirgatae]ODP37019.1 hypothetical protein BFL28_19205 [Sphingomonas turrisvirgatae]